MGCFGNGRVAIVDDPVTADRLAWPRRKRSLPDPILLSPTAGDPRFEPWIARRRPHPGIHADALWRRSAPSPGWTYLQDLPGVDKYLQRMAKADEKRHAVVGLIGLGRVGGLAAGALCTQRCAQSRIGTLLIHDADTTNLERWRLELGAVAAWSEPHALPEVRVATLADMFQQCDAVVYAAATGVPPLDATGDMRLPQFPDNRIILQEALTAAREANYAGLFFMVSDPVECLAQASFHDSNVDAAGAFTGLGLAPERIAGLALGVMWGRALAAARLEGQEERVGRTGLPLGPHSTEVLVYDDPVSPNDRTCRRMSDAARHGNYRIRELGYLPYIGPALSSIALTLPRLLAGKEVLASPFVGGLYFGAPSRLDWGVVPRTLTLAPSVRAQISDLHHLLDQRMARLGVRFHVPNSVP